MKGHEIIIQILSDENVGTIFTLMSEDTMSLMSKIESERKDSIRMIKTRHEQSAMAMADGYARAENRIGVCLVGRGPAVAQTGTALVTARKKGSNVLVIVPETPLSNSYDIKEFEQESYLRSTIGTVESIRSHETLISDFREAIRRVKVGDGPLAVQIPWDLLDSEMNVLDSIENNCATDPESTTYSNARVHSDDQARVHPDETLIEKAIDMYVESDAFQPPVILAGHGAIQAGAKEAIEELAERTSALLATSLQARNYFADHPYYLGFTGSWGSNVANQYANESHLVFAIGASLNPYTIDNGHVFGDDTQIIHIDQDLIDIGGYADINLGIQGDARITTEALVEELERRDIHREGELWSDRLRTEIEESSPMNEQEFPDVPDTVDPRELVTALNEILPENRKVVTDAGHFTRWVVDGIQTDPEDFTFTLDFAAIGLGFPMGVGTAVAATDCSCITICGDAGFMMSMQDLETAVRNNIPMTIIVMNDSSLGSEYHSLAVKGEDPNVALVSSPDFADIAESIGAEGHTVRSFDDLHTISDKLGQKPEGPLVIDCKVNHNVRHRSKT
jgi:thiamine pyrophosphate-dependent acetolactate synthase large subunit-like protein